MKAFRYAWLAALAFGGCTHDFNTFEPSGAQLQSVPGDTYGDDTTAPIGRESAGGRRRLLPRS